MASVPSSNSRPILITGGTGKTGRRVAGLLSNAGHAVRIGSRNAARAFDWTQPATWQRALEGVGSVYLAYQPDLAVPGALDTIAEFLAEVRRAGVEHVALLSGRGEAEAEQAEGMLVGSGLEWTILRASWFMQNFSESFFADGIAQGQLIVPNSLAPEPFTDADDIAEAAARSLTDRRHRGRLYELTGPEALTFAQAGARIASVTGRPIDVIEVPLGDYLAGLEAHGVPDDATWLIGYLFSTVLDGRNTALATGVEEACGRPPSTIEEFAERAVAARAWQ